MPKTGHEHLADQVGIGHRAGGGSNTYCSRGNDHFQVGILREQSLGFVVALGIVIVTIDHFIQFQLGIFRLLEFRLHDFDPGILVRGCRRGAQDRDLTTIGTGKVGGHLDLDRADILQYSLVDVEVASIGSDGRIPGNDRDAGFHGGFAGRDERIGVIRRDSQATGLLRDQGVQQGDLFGGVGGGRTLVLDFDALIPWRLPGRRYWRYRSTGYQGSLEPDNNRLRMQLLQLPWQQALQSLPELP